MNDERQKDFANLMRNIIDTMADSANVPPQLIEVNSMKDFINGAFNAITSFTDVLTGMTVTKKKAATDNETDMLAEDARNWGYDYILEHYDRYDIQDMGSWIYQVVSDEVYQYIRDVIINEYDFSDDDWDMMYDALADIVYSRVDFSYVWDAIDVVLNAPQTMEEKLAEVGMSVRDFL